MFYFELSEIESIKYVSPRKKASQFIYLLPYKIDRRQM